jgi:hypothetical protein
MSKDNDMPGFTPMRLYLDGDGAFARFRGREIIHVTQFDVTALAGGTDTGKPSVALVVELPDGRVVFAETTLVNLLMAADAFKGRHGDPRSPDWAKGGPLA